MTVSAGYRRLVYLTLLAALPAAFWGGIVRVTGSGLGCPDWPLCHGQFLPSLDVATRIEWTHRFLAIVAGLTLAALALWTLLRYRTDRRALAFVGAAVLLYWLQAILGAITVLLELPDTWVTIHLANAELLLAVLTAYAIVVRWPAVGAALARPTAFTWLALGAAAGTFVLMLSGAYVRGDGATAACSTWPLCDNVALTKPAIMSLLLVTALGGMFLAAGGVPPLHLLVATMIGGAFASGGASALNHYFDRDIDERMRRTSRRPIPGQRISPRVAIAVGVILNVIAFAVLALVANLLAAILAIVGTLFYILVYTLWLKRTTVQNIVIGGAAGAIPPLVGWAAITGSLDLSAWLLFAIIFFWTPAHFWALALLIRDDYERAG